MLNLCKQLLNEISKYSLCNIITNIDRKKYNLDKFNKYFYS